MSRARIVGIVIATALVASSWVDAKKPKPPKPTPCVGTYVLDAPLVGTATPDAFVIGTTIASLSGCPAVPVKLKAKKKVTLVRARWSACEGITGKAIFAGKIPAGCTTLTGVFKAKKAKIRRAITAGRSPCGDGLIDADRESCEGPTGCAIGQQCSTACTCSGTNCGPNAPQAQFSVGGTAVAGQAMTFDATASSDADGDPLVYAWTFGDDRRGGGAKIAHLYPTAGARTVRLTVSDGCGHTATHEENVVVAAGPAPTATTTARGRIHDVAGLALAGADVHAEPGGSATSNSAGDVTVSVGQGVPVRITVTKDGYAEQVLLTQVPDLPEPDAYFEATLLQRQPAQSLSDAAAGGTVGGTDGAQVALPANALIDGAGNAVGGAVDVFITPVDVVNRVRAFPGRAFGLSPDGTQSPIVTYGTVEYAFAQNGVALNLAPGVLATIEIPIYASKNLNGSALAVGDKYPLWSLDPATAQWVAEGEGTVVASTTSPSGLALRGQVTHFSFWNHDSRTDPYFPKPRCKVDTNADGILEDLTGTGHCWHGGTGPEQPDDGFFQPQARGRAVIAPSYPNWIGQEVLPASGGIVLAMPSEMDVTLHSRAKGGLLQGSKTLRGPAFLEEDIDIVLEPVEVDGDHITIPFQAERTISQADSLHVFDFDGTAGQTVFVTVEEPDTSITAADVTMLLPDDSELGPALYRPLVNDDARMGLLLPSTGNYRIVVNLYPGASAGLYRIRVDYTADFPIILSTTPASNATGVATAATPAVTFSRTVANALSFDLEQAGAGVSGSTGVSGATATFTPTAPLIAGAAYTAEISGFRTPGETEANGFPRRHSWSFNVTETAGTFVPIGPARGVVPEIVSDATGHAYVVWQRGVPNTSNHETWAARYTPSVGWSTPTRFFDGAKIGGAYGASVAALPNGAIALWTDPHGNQTSIYESRFTEADGWSLPTPIENVATEFSQTPSVGADAAGNVIATFGTTAPAGQGDVHWSRYTAGGAWTTPDILLDDVRNPALAVGASGHAVAAAETLGSGMTVVRRYTPGQGWSALETFEAFDAVSLAVDANGNSFVLVTSTSAQQVLHRFDVGTQAWSAPLTLQTGVTCPSESRVVVSADGSAMVIGCTNVAPGPGTFTVRYTPGGGWGSSELLTSNNVLPDIGVDATGNALATWFDNGLTGGFYKRYTAGVGWEGTTHTFPAVTFFAWRRLAVGGNGAAVMVQTANDLQPMQGVRLP